MRYKKILFALMGIVVISSYGFEIFDASGKKIIDGSSADSAEEIMYDLRMNYPLNRYYFRSA